MKKAGEVRFSWHGFSTRAGDSLARVTNPCHKQLLLLFSLCTLCTPWFNSSSNAADAAPDSLGEIFYVPFDGDSPTATIARGKPESIHPVITSYEAGPVGKAAVSAGHYNGIRWDARGNIDFDRGTMTFFTKSLTDVAESEWETYGGVWTDIDGYWGGAMQFHQLSEKFCMQLFDNGRYAQRVWLKPIVGRWKKDQWVHLACVWDRNEGIKIYEDGKLIDSNWGKHGWNWAFTPRVLHVGGTIYSVQKFAADELHIYSECLTDDQIAELAAGRKPARPPIPITPPENRRDNDLARMGWTDEDLKQIPTVQSGSPIQYTFARIDHAIDAKRQVAQPFEGLNDSCWPLSKYGASIGGRTLELYFAPAQQPFDRVRIFAQRPVTGRVSQMHPINGLEPIIEVDAPRPYWRGTFPQPRTDPAIFLQREQGSIGQIDFFSVAPAPMVKYGENQIVQYFTAAKLDRLPITEAGKAAMGDTPTRFQSRVRATKTGGADFDLGSPAFGGFQLLSEPITESAVFDSVIVTLVTGKLAKPTPVQIVVKEPVWAVRDWLRVDAILQPSGKDREEFRFIVKGRPVLTPVPGFKVTRGDNVIEQPEMELGVHVTAAEPVTWKMGTGNTSVFLVRGDEKQKAIAIADQIEFAREAFAESMEGHIWDGHAMEMWGRVAYPELYLLGVAPDVREVMQLATCLGWRKESLPFKEPVNTLKAPEWAFWQMEALKENLRLLHWIIDHRQNWNGEFGGVWGDDTDMLENWIDFALMGDDDRKVTKSIRLLCDGLWKYNCVEGVSASIRDALHAYEEGMGTIAMQLLIDYGDPVPIEHTMRICHYYDKWMKRNQDGSYSFKGWYWGATGVWEQGDYSRDTGTNALAFIPAAYLIWYNHHPWPQPYIKQWKLVMDSPVTTDIIYDLMSEPEREKFRVDYYTKEADRLIKESRYSMMTNAIIDEIGMKDEWRKAYEGLGRYASVPGTAQMALHMTDAYWASYLATGGDVNQLTKSYKDTCVLLNNLDWTYTAAQPSTDRIPPPHTTLSRARMGSMAANRGGNGWFWPRHGISYTKGANQVAALVKDNTYTALSSRFWAFPEKEHDVQLRVWRLWPGKYTVTLAKDANDDGVGEDVISTSEQMLQRGSYIDLKLPPRQGVVLTIKALDAKPPTFDKPDPAIGLGDVQIEYASGHMKVTVHNVGTKAAENIVVRVTDPLSGAVVAEEKIANIEAPNDLVPRTQVIEFHNLDCVTCGRATVELNPGGKPEDDLNPFNNRVEYKY